MEIKLNIEDVKTISSYRLSEYKNKKPVYFELNIIQCEKLFMESSFIMTLISVESVTNGNIRNIPVKWYNHGKQKPEG